MQSFSPEERDLYYDVRDQLHGDLMRRAQIFAARRQQQRESIRTLDQYLSYKESWRRNLLHAIGGLPTERTPLNARLTGTFDAGPFVVEKVIFESLPRFFVTGDCYVPKHLSASAPAVLLLQGHVNKPWPAYQALCGDLASTGFITLMIDPIGQGERSQYYEHGRFNLMSVNTEHNQAGASLFLNGQSIARYMAWDAIRALDYLSTRKDVDATRLAATGHSGGGWQTLLLMNLDDRLAAAAPCAVVTTHQWIIKCAQPVDCEHVLHRAVELGPDYDDLLTAMAPKPVIALATNYDCYFPIEGTLEAADWAKRVYALHGKPDAFTIVRDDAPHEYTKPLREACVGSFKQHLMGKSDGFREENPPVLRAEDLRVTKSGQTVADEPTATTIADISANIAPPTLPKRSPGNLRRELDDILGVSRAGDRNAAIHPRIDTKIERDGYPLEKILFFSATDVMLTAMMCHPRGATPDRRLPTVVFLTENGTAEASDQRPRIESHLMQNRRVVVLDTRGVGAIRARRRVPAFLETNAWRFLNTEYVATCDAIQLGLSMLGLRVFDTLRCLDYLATRRDVESIAIHGVGQTGLCAFFAGALDDRFVSTTCEETLCSYRLLTQTPYFNNNLNTLSVLPWGLLTRFDLPDLLPCFGQRQLHLLHPRDARGQPASESQMGALYRNSGENLRISI